MKMNHDEYCMCRDCVDTEILILIQKGKLKRIYDKQIGDFRYYVPEQ